MAREQSAFGFPNFLDVSFTGSGITEVIIGGGDWLDTRPLTNLLDPLLKNQARSASLVPGDLTFEVDLGAGRDVKINFIPDSNMSNTAQIRLEASNTIAWANVIVDGVNSIGATTLNIASGATAATIVTGQIFKIAGDDTVYTVVTGDTLTASDTGAITLKRSNIAGTGLVVGTTGGEAITSHSGDYSGGLLDTGFNDSIPVIYEFGTLEFGHPSFFDGKPTAEDRLRLKIPFRDVQGETILAAYWRYSITDADNLDGFVEIPRLHICRGYLPTKGIRYGSAIKRTSTTSRRTTPGGTDFHTKNPNRRSWQITIQNLPENEAISRWFDIQDEADIDVQGVFIKNIDTNILSHATDFLFRFEKLDPIAFPFFDTGDIIGELREVTG